MCNFFVEAMVVVIVWYPIKSCGGVDTPITDTPLYCSKQLEEHVGGKEVQQAINDEVAKQQQQMDEVVEKYKIK